MTRTAYQLVPRSAGGFHLGREGMEQETSADTFPSDSLFSALVATIAQVSSDVDVAAFLDAMQSSKPPLILTSVFPRLGDLPLLPMPRLRVVFNEPPQRLGKLLKSIRFVSPAIFDRLVNQQPMDDWLPDIGRSSSLGVLLNGKRAWIAADEIQYLPGHLASIPREVLTAEALWTTDPVQRVTIDRTTNASAVYQVGRTVFLDGCGLWFMADVDDDWIGFLDDLLDILGDSGIGGERSSGYGTFSAVKMDAPKLNEPQKMAYAVSLSRYHPSLEELESGIFNEASSYDLVDIGGWMSFPGYPAQRRQRVRMLEAGSVINVQNGVPLGQLADVRPVYEGVAFEQPIYRSGIAMFAGISGRLD